MCKVKWADYLVKVKAEPRKWLWPQRIPSNEITLIAGIQGKGKSLLCTDLAAHITTGTSWPDGAHCPCGDIILIQAEDSITQTVRPRYDAAGADPMKVIFVRGVPVSEGKLAPFMLPRDLPSLIRLIKQADNPKAIIIDPIGSYIGDIDTHRENQVRSIMYALKMEIAERYSIAILIVVHLKKSGAEDPVLSRVLGSVAFTGAARTVWGVGEDKDDPSRRFFVPMKHNLTAGKTPGLEFFLETAPNGEGIVRWGKETHETAGDVMQDFGEKPQSQLNKAKKMIHDALQAGPQDASVIKEKILQEDVGSRTISTAKAQLGIKSVKDGGKWMWSLPT